MLLTKRIEYSVRALVLLATAPQTMKAEALAEAHEIPAGYLRVLLADLRRADLVQVSRGNGGGYVLARPAADITLGDIVRSLDGSQNDPPGDTPPEAAIERLRTLWHTANEARLDYLDSITLADIVTGTP